MQRSIQFYLNGAPQTLEVQTHETALDVLRRRLELRGVRATCGIGICGACTILVDGRPISGCLLLAPLLDGRAVTTIEGLEQDGTLDPIQAAFIERMGFQCSYCTPGMILTTKALLAEQPHPTVEQIKEYLAGNLCRCGSYVKIIEAVQLASALNAADRR
jgi:aerobic-type carbon monoxide dehydrogenase small subunit (CoxS/CutS family)